MIGRDQCLSRRDAGNRLNPINWLNGDRRQPRVARTEVRFARDSLVEGASAVTYLFSIIYELISDRTHPSTHPSWQDGGGRWRTCIVRVSGGSPTLREAAHLDRQPGRHSRVARKHQSFNEILERLDAALRSPKQDANGFASTPSALPQCACQRRPGVSRSSVRKNANLAAVSEACRNLRAARSSARLSPYMMPVSRAYACVSKEWAGTRGYDAALGQRCRVAHIPTVATATTACSNSMILDDGAAAPPTEKPAQVVLTAGSSSPF